MLKRLGSQDLAAALALDRSAGPFPWSESDWLYSLEQDDCVAVCAQDGEFAAVAVLASVCDEVNLLNIAVHADHQRKGYARRLLEQCLREYLMKGMKHCFLEVRRSNVSAIRLYEGLGFEPIGERKAYYPIPGGREDAIVMLCQLGKSENYART